MNRSKCKARFRMAPSPGLCYNFPMNKLIRPGETLRVIKENNFQFQKRFGQNFLIDESVLRDILIASEITREDCVLEIGPGIGTLTQALCESARKVIAVELDKKLIPILEENLSAYDNLRLIQGDALRLDLIKLIGEENDGQPIKVAANLPYYITSPILFSLLESRAPIRSITIMVQREVAERMRALPGTKSYGALSLAVQYYADIELVRQVAPGCFLPRPNVGSAVVRLILKNETPENPEEEAFLFRLIRAAFATRRKTLANALSGGLSLRKERTEEALRELGLSENIRGEALSLSQFSALSALLRGK